ncbi:hypothetical protein [uncultured Pontibacter sp.]|uniref:hypothetical protein n=1 Tax=uncultured Pontibacter sp. TaxID=453356 RepID=UPI002618A84D|nr:hypothetical protein [uncultured Pontibacter sp.]
MSNNRKPNIAHASDSIANSQLLADLELLLNLEKQRCNLIEQITTLSTKVNDALTKNLTRKKHIPSEETGEFQDYFSIHGYAKLTGRKGLSRKGSIMLGKMATKLSNERGVVTKNAEHQTFGYVNTYHRDILGEVFRHCGL